MDNLRPSIVEKCFSEPEMLAFFSILKDIAIDKIDAVTYFVWAQQGLVIWQLNTTTNMWCHSIAGSMT